MECLNTDNAAKGNLGKKRRTVGAKPTSLSSTNMKQPMPVGKENGKAAAAAAAA